MATNIPPTPTLTCKDCGYSNEPERVYCHNCGAKLDRSVLPKEEQIRRESPDKARKRIMRMANPPSATVRREIMALFKTLIFSVLAASLIQAARPPEQVPPERSEAPTRLISSELGDLATSPSSRAASFTEAEINGYLRSGKVKDQGNVPGVEFKRAFANLEPGTCRLSVEKALAGFPLYMGALYRVEGSNGVLTSVNLGGNFGRLPVHPLIMERIAPFLFGQLFEALKREFDTLKKMQSLVIRKERVDLVGGGAKK